MAHRRLTLAELRAEGTDVAFALGEDQDHLEPGGVADVLEQDRGAFGLLETMVDGLGDLARPAALGAGALGAGALGAEALGADDFGTALATGMTSSSDSGE